MYSISFSLLVISIAPFKKGNKRSYKGLYSMPYVENSQKNLPSLNLHNYKKIFKVLGVCKMKDLSKEERLNKRILELERQIAEKDYAFDKERGRRLKRTFFVVSGAIYLLAFMCGVIRGDIKEYLIWLIIAPIMAVLVMFISFWVMFYITNGATNRAETIAKLEGELNAVKSEKYNNLEDEKIKELERHIEYLESYYAHKCNDCTFLKLLVKNTEENEESNEVEKNEED